MKKTAYFVFFVCFSILFGLSSCHKDYLLEPELDDVILKKGGKPSGETAGNNLSYPVIWSEGVTKTLAGTSGMVPLLNGEWWYSWGSNGTDPNIVPASCPPDPDESNFELNPEGDPYCDDGIDGSLTIPAGEPLADNQLPLAKAYLQKDPNNIWQAGSADWSNAPVDVHWIDWGDNLESVDWYTRSQVRTEVVLFQDLDAAMTEYEMRHTSGWGIDEVHGMAANLKDVPLEGSGERATIYSNCARLTIQKLLVDRDDPNLAYLIWIPEVGWTEPEYYPEVNEEGDLVPFTLELINDHIFNGSVHEGGDGPGYYSAEINVKGRIIYGYTWNVRADNDMTGGTPAGDYRITFSFDANDNANHPLNTFFKEGITEIMVPIEEEVLTAVMLAESDDSGDTGGATGILDYDNNLTCIDVRILERGGGGGGGSKGGGKGVRR